MICEVKKGGEMAGGASPSCIFCQIASSTTLLHSDEKAVAFQDINPSALRHYLVVPVEHIPTVKDLQREKNRRPFFGESHVKCRAESVAQRCTPVQAQIWISSTSFEQC
ncbi:unnamed protein product [Camellia sinensis]